MSQILFNKKDYVVLEALIERTCNSPVASLTIKQLMRITRMSLSKIRSVKNDFLLMNFILEGSKDGNNKTFYYTDEGLNHFKKVFNFSDDRIKQMQLNFEEEYERGDQ